MVPINILWRRMNIPIKVEQSITLNAKNRGGGMQKTFVLNLRISPHRLLTWLHFIS